MGVNVNEGRVVPGFDGVISDISEGRKEEHFQENENQVRVPLCVLR